MDSYTTNAGRKFLIAMRPHPSPSEHSTSLFGEQGGRLVGSRYGHVAPLVSLMGAKIHCISEQECVDYVIAETLSGCGGFVITMNLDHLRRFVQTKTYADCARQASLVTADGMPLLWASQIQKTPLPERVTGSSLIWSLSERAAQTGRSIFLLGGAPGTAVESSRVLCQRFPNLIVAGTLDQDVDPSDSWEALAPILVPLELAKPDIVFVALGSPKQEQLILRLRDRFPAIWWLGVGISFSFVAGTIPRAPLWMQRAGLEWFYRLLQEPRRLAYRYLMQDIPFAVRLLGSVLLRRFGSQSASQ